MAFHQFEASAISAKNENNISLVHSSVDFALVRVEVPKEFEGLGKALSQHRRKNAESGPQHRTARRLGALFELVIPNIEVLAAAYGERVSEIATSSQFDLKADEYGPFAEHVGVDGTSIYAAVSSGNSEIALHLLACMLARMFTAAEATAIWAQLVDHRLKELKEKSASSQVQGLAALYAEDHGRQIMRDDLAKWDASARAWLQTANQAKRHQDTQLKLIVKNVPSIQASATTYANVIENWKVAMTTIQKSIQGVPQAISNSAVLLGFMSWHIYPDLHVFCPNQHVEFHDPLVKAGGVVTLGLEQKEKICNGVSWSVSLSHLRYYGDPVVIEKSSEEDSDRITAQELLYVTFGCVLASWAKPASVNITDAAECFDALGDALQLDDSKDDDSALSWLALLVKAARGYLSPDTDRENTLYFIEFGRRRGRKLLDDSFRGISAMFGLSNPYMLFQLSTEFDDSFGDSEASIAMLRRLCKDCNLDRRDGIILSRPGNLNDSATVASDPDWELASIAAGGVAESGELPARHTRWVHLVPTARDAMRGCNCSGTACKDCSCRAQGIDCTLACGCLRHFDGLQEPSCRNIPQCAPLLGDANEACFWLSRRNISMTQRTELLRNQGETFTWFDPPSEYVRREPPRRRLDFQPPWAGGAVHLRSVEANGSAALFVVDSANVDMPSYSLPTITRLLRARAIVPFLLKHYLTTVPEIGIRDYSKKIRGELCYSKIFFDSLKAVAAVRELYGDWPATISMSITKQPLGLAHWSVALRQAQGTHNAQFWRSVKFSCLAMVESGGHNIHPQQLEVVMAMATGNSIYASEGLIQDPTLPDSSGSSEFRGIRRVIGNIGYPGVVLLVPPPSPRVLQVDGSRWRFTQAQLYDGAPRDLFSQTSMHLTFTDFTIPLASARGAVDADVVMREALISVFDGSKWIADLDVLKSLGENLDYKPVCRHKGDQVGELLLRRFGQQLKDITTWDELLVCEENLMEDEMGVVRAHGNWFARLCAAALAKQMGLAPAALSQSVCSRCCDGYFERSDGTQSLKLFIA